MLQHMLWTILEDKKYVFKSLAFMFVSNLLTKTD